MSRLHRESYTYCLFTAHGCASLWRPVQVETIHCEDHCMVGTLMSECCSIEVAILTLWGPLQVSIIHCQDLDV